MTMSRDKTRKFDTVRRKSSKKKMRAKRDISESGRPDGLSDNDAIQYPDDMLDEDDIEDEPDRAFLLNLDIKKVSKSKSELNQAYRKELAQQRVSRDQASQSKLDGQAKSDDGESTDMEGASLPSDSDSGGELDSETEAEHLAHIRRTRKRKDQQEEERAIKVAKRRLPTRKDENWSSGEGSNADEGEEGERRNSSRSVHAKHIQDEIMKSEDEQANSQSTIKRQTRTSSITTSSRFGLRAPFEIFSQKKRNVRISSARDQIARLSTSIINDPEMSLGLLKRLVTFLSPKVRSPEDKNETVPVDEPVRAFAILSLCAIFIDILPGYRIRDLTETEKQERVNQELAQRREYEQGLVVVFGDYLKMCEMCARNESEILRAAAIRAMSSMAEKAIHFNHRTNLLRSLVSLISRRQWDQHAEMAYHSLVGVLQNDRQGDASLETVRLLNRMIKERQFKVDAKVLDILLHLRLRDELPSGKRATTTTSSGESLANDVYDKKLKSKDIRKGKGQHLTKRDAKKRKELREIEDEMKEAEAEVDRDEREKHQTETLKLLFVIYFSLIKASNVNHALLLNTMNGLTKYAHRISIEFFRDLLAAIRKHVRDALNHDLAEGEEGIAQRTTLALHCISTAFELLSGQGEALNIDLSDLVGDLYTVMMPLCLSTAIEQKGQGGQSSAHLLIRALQLALVAPPVHVVPQERLAAFAVRMSACALHVPAQTCLALLQTLHVLVRRHPALRSLLDNGEDRARNGNFNLSSDHVEGLRPLQAGTVLWCLTTLRHSGHDDVSQQADAILRET